MAAHITLKSKWAIFLINWENFMSLIPYLCISYFIQNIKPLIKSLIHPIMESEG
jgi:hypothetical protein